METTLNREKPGCVHPTTISSITLLTSRCSIHLSQTWSSYLLQLNQHHLYLLLCQYLRRYFPPPLLLLCLHLLHLEINKTDMFWKKKTIKMWDSYHNKNYEINWKYKIYLYVTGHNNTKIVNIWNAAIAMKIAFLYQIQITQ